MKKSKKCRISKGFTLVELLVVISIIALLLAILIPSLSKAKEVAQRIVCGNHLKDFGTANATYANTCNGYFLPMDFLDPNSNGTTKMGVPVVNYDERHWLENRLFRSFVNYDKYQKEKKNPAPSSGAYNGPLNMPLALACPSDKIVIDWKKQRDGVLVSYGYNLTDWPYVWSGPLALAYMGHKMDDVKTPSAKLTFIDSVDWWVTWGCRAADPKDAWDKHHQMGIAAYRGEDEGRGITSCYGPTIYRHSEGANVGFYDGHVKYMKKGDIFVRDDYYDSGGAVLKRPYQRPGMWVVDYLLYTKNHSALCGDGS